MQILHLPAVDTFIEITKVVAEQDFHTSGKSGAYARYIGIVREAHRPVAGLMSHGGHDGIDGKSIIGPTATAQVQAQLGGTVL